MNIINAKVNDHNGDIGNINTAALGVVFKFKVTRYFASHICIPWNKGGEIGWLLELENLESDSGNLEIYSVANRKPMQLRENGCDVAKTRFFSTTRARVF